MSKRLFIPASLLDFQVQASIFWRASRVLRRRVLSDILVPMSHYRIATRLERRCRTSRSDHDMSHNSSDAGAISSYHRGHDVGNGTTQFSSAQTLVASLSACACCRPTLVLYTYQSESSYVVLYRNTVASASHDLDMMLLACCHLLKVFSTNTCISLDHAAVASRARPGVCLLQLNPSTK